MSELNLRDYARRYVLRSAYWEEMERHLWTTHEESYKAGFLKAIEVAEALAEGDLPPDAERNAVRRGMRDIVAELKKTAGA